MFQVKNTVGSASLQCFADCLVNAAAPRLLIPAWTDKQDHRSSALQALNAGGLQCFADCLVNAAAPQLLIPAWTDKQVHMSSAVQNVLQPPAVPGAPPRQCCCATAAHAFAVDSCCMAGQTRLGNPCCCSTCIARLNLQACPADRVLQGDASSQAVALLHSWSNQARSSLLLLLILQPCPARHCSQAAMLLLELVKPGWDHPCCCSFCGP
jgi:hypothetical protein